MSTNPTNEPLPICGLICSSFGDEEEVRKTLANLIREGKGGYSVAINAEKIARAKKDVELRNVLTNANLAVPDGFLAVFALRWIHGRRSIKVDLPRCALKQANISGWRVAICGAHEDVNKAAVIEIKLQYPDLKIVASIDGYQSHEAIRDMIMAHKPDIAFLAMGSPKQEMLAQSWQRDFGKTLVIGCGGALDILAGRIKRAPRFFVENGLEWLYRLIQNPKRARRQLVLPLAAFYVFVEGLRKSDPAEHLLK